MFSMQRLICSALANADLRDIGSRFRIYRQCRGYSSASHWRFFRWVAKQHRPQSLCVLGVYFGRDIANLCHVLGQLPQQLTGFQIVGVDKFQDSACEDWPEEARQKSWEEAGFGPAPRIEQTRENLKILQFDTHVELLSARAEDFLAATTHTFDFIYVDTSHDYESTLHTIRLSQRCLKPNGLIAGDDYSDKGTWGVRRAVKEAFVSHHVYDAWIWWAEAKDFKNDGSVGNASGSSRDNAVPPKGGLDATDLPRSRPQARQVLR